MKKMLISILGVFLLFVFSSLLFGDSIGPDAKKLWNYITKESNYKKWSNWPDHKGMQKGRAPHGPYHIVYVNDKALHSKKPPVQYGSIIVKENYNKKKQLKIITVMYKIKGYNPDNGDWFWVKYSANGKVLKVGKPKGCIGCHGVRYKNDFILLHEFK